MADALADGFVVRTLGLRLKAQIMPDISSGMFMPANVFVRAIDFLLVVQVERPLIALFALPVE